MTPPTFLENLLHKITQAKASDLHVKTDMKPYLRIDGEVLPIEDLEGVDSNTLKKEVYSYLSEKKREQFSRDGTVEFALESQDLHARFRGSFYLERGKPALNLRFIPVDVPSFDSLGLPVSLLKLTQESRGIILVTGPTGSGKSTTLAAMVEHINQAQRLHIITLEDPIEFVYVSKKSLVSQRELGEDFDTFANALRHALRQDPDTILVGELRDLETIRLALHAAETGHLVLSTTHTVDAVQTIARIIDVFPAHEQTNMRTHLADLLKGIVALRLIRRKDAAGRIPACEILIGSGHARKLVADNKLGELPKAMESGSHYGMQTYLQSLLEIYQNGLASFEECQAAATNPDDFATRARGVSIGTK